MKEVTNFITGTGRCGSTILSRMLMNHPDACVLRELLSIMDFRKMTHEKVSGEGLATLISGDLHPVILFIQRGGTMQEILYKLSDAEKKQPFWSKPGVLLTTLPYLTDEPEKLFGELVDWAKKQPTAPLSVHYPRLFKLIAEKTGRSIPIEASAAGNIDLEIFPNSRILQIHRSGPEVILSMCAHPWFRMLSSILIDPLSDEEMKVAVECSEPEESDPILKRMKMKDEQLYPMLILFWTTMLTNNYRVLQHVPPENYMEVSFEELAQNPRSHIVKVADFFELPDRGEAWLDEASKLLKPVKLRLPETDEKTQQYLQQMCFPGQALMGRLPIPEADVFMLQMFKAHEREIVPLA